MKISFVIPAYNEEKFLRPCLQSILDEARAASHLVEIIVVNNASTDSTKQVALSFPGVIVVDELKKGLTHARVAGFRAATGDLVANLDADSMLTPGWINNVVNQFLRRPQLVAVSGPVIYHDMSLGSNLLIRIYYYAAYVNYFLNRLLFRVCVLAQGSNLTVKKFALDKIGGYNDKIVFYGEDTELGRRISKIGPVLFTFKIPIYTSGRRFYSEGLIVTGFNYALNFFWINLFRRPYHQVYTDVRQQTEKTATTNMGTLNSTLTAIIIIVAIWSGVFLFYGARTSTAAALGSRIHTIEIKGRHSWIVRSVNHAYHKTTANINKRIDRR
ncbi:MAG TPA: glycosyltransferase family 2 protein [Patescibacteria group bacterium]